MRPLLNLPEGTVVLDVARATREAIERFLALEPTDKHGLARWLLGPYHGATRFAPRRLRATTHETLHGAAVPLSVGELVAHAQNALCDAIDAASEPGSERLLAMLPDTLDVIPVRDALDERGFAAQDVAHRRLAERTMTLLLADYLTRPDEFVAKGGPGAARRPSVRMLALG